MAGSLDIALSGLMAQTRRLDASASNVANQRTNGALPNAAGQTPAGASTVYQPLDVAQSAVGGAGNPQGTRASFTKITPAYLPEYDPQASFANADGMVAAPNVDLGRETVNQITASSVYRANMAVVKSSDEMLKSVMDAKA